MALATLGELRDHLRTEGVIARTDATKDAYLTMLLEAASDFLEGARPERTLEPFGSVTAPEALTFPAARVVQIPDLRAGVPPVVELDGVALASDAYRLSGRRGDGTYLWIHLRHFGHVFPGYGEGAIYAHAGRELVIRGAWGAAEVWPKIKLAVLNLAARAYHNRTSRFADSVVDPAGGVASYFRQMPADVQAVVDGLWVPGL